MALTHPERLASLTLVSTSAAGYDHGPKIRKIDEIARTKDVQTALTKWIQATLRYFGSDLKHVRDLLEVMMRDHSGAIWADPMRGKYPPENDLARVDQIEVEIQIEEILHGSDLTIRKLCVGEDVLLFEELMQKEGFHLSVVLHLMVEQTGNSAIIHMAHECKKCRQPG